MVPGAVIDRQGEGKRIPMLREDGAPSAAGDRCPAASEKMNSIREFWDTLVYDDTRVLSHPAGTKEYFAELEAYRRERLDYLPDHVDFTAYRGHRVLDVGCRVGLDLARFAREGAMVTGVDIAPRCIETARAFFALNDLEGDFRVMNGEALEFEDGSFDLVYAHGVVQYTENPAKMVGEIRRVLKPGGEVVVMAYNRRSWLSLLSRFSGKSLQHEDAPVFYPFSIGQFRDLLAGFSNVTISPERFPATTGLHKGRAASFYYAALVGLFRLIPRPVVRPFGAHLLAKAAR